MLRKKTNGVAIGSRTSSFIGKVASKVVDRRTFLRSSGLAVGGIAAVTALSGKMVKPALASTAGGNISVKKSVCSHCAVVVRLWPKSKMVFGLDKSLDGTAR